MTRIHLQREDARKGSLGRAPPRGVTLLELTVVVLLLGIFSAIAGPRFSATIGRHRADSTARRIAADLELARNTARTTSKAQTVNFDKTANTYALPGLGDPDHPSKTYTIYLSQTPYPAKLTTVSVGGDNSLIFDGFGNPDSGATITVGSGTYARSVVVNATTGTVTVP